MIEIIRSATFDAWLTSVKDRQARARILVRIDRLAAGNPGDVKPVGSGVSALRIPYGPGYSLYVIKRGDRIAILLCGGDKATQKVDIELAKAIAEDWKG